MITMGNKIGATLSCHQLNQTVEQKIVFVTLDEILNHKKVYYTVLDQDISISNSSEDPYKKVMPRKLTLVLELVDILVKVVDINSDSYFPLSDQSQHQIVVTSK